MLLQATHQLGEVIYDTSSGIKWEFMSIISVTFALLRSLCVCDKFGLDLEY